MIMPHSRGGLLWKTAYQFYRLVPKDVIEMSTVLGLDDYSPEGVDRAIKEYWRCVEVLAREKADVIVLGGSRSPQSWVGIEFWSCCERRRKKPVFRRIPLWKQSFPG